MKTKLPTYDQLMNPLLRALVALGGSGSIEEIYNKVVELEQFSDEGLARLHDPEKSHETEVGYRLAWARTYLKKYGLLENSSRGVWALTAKAKDIKNVDPQSVVKTVKALGKSDTETKQEDGTDSEVPEGETWKEHLHVILTQRLSPAAFERLVQRVLRESGFIHVEVTGRSGDGRIDGKGIARVYGLMNFHVLFQCKRYKGSVPSSEIRDFPCPMVRRADRGLVISIHRDSCCSKRRDSRRGAPNRFDYKPEAINESVPSRTYL